MDSYMFAYLVEDFIKLKKTEKPFILIVDNATFHTSNDIQEKRKAWKQQEVQLQFIPAYCPELNKIEILWKQVKHDWLSINDWLSAEKLKEAVLNIWLSFGEKYKINFKI